MKNITLIFLLASLAAGCASRPPEVVASRPLVEAIRANGGDEFASSSLEEFLNTAVAGATFSDDGQQFQVLRRYYSALGSDCVQYEKIGTASQRLVACKDESQWMLYPWMSSGISGFGSQEVN